MTTIAPLNLQRTTLGPLITTFTPPSECWYRAIQRTSWDSSTGYQGESCESNHQYGQADATTCWPHTTWPAPSPTGPLGAWGFYSPGLICPSGYTTAVIATAGGDPTWPVPFVPLEGETIAGCCPSGFTWIYPNTTIVGGISCGSTATSTIATFATCNAGDTMIGEALVITYPFVSPVTTAGVIGTLTTQPTVSSLILWAPMIHMYWHSTDREVASVSETTFSTTFETSNADNNGSPAGMSNGAIAGIAVACVIGGLAMGTAIVFLIRRRRQRGKTQALATSGSSDRATKVHQHQQEQHSQYLIGLSEIDSRTQVSELLERRAIHEMDGNHNSRG